MRKLYVILISVFLTGFFTLSAQWAPMGMGTLIDVSYPKSDSMNIIAVGEKGLVLKSVDGGLTWSQIQTAAKNDIKKVFFPTKQDGYFVEDGWGMPDKIYKTNNAGSSWTKLPIDSIMGIHCIYFTGRDTGFVGTTWYGVYRTINGGLNWTKVGFVSDYVNGFAFQNPSAGYFVGDNRMIYKTTDFGATWMDADPIDTLFYSNYNSVYFNGMNGIIATQSGWLLKTFNGGATWQQEWQDGMHRQIAFQTPMRGVILGDMGKYLKTIDGGATWTLSLIHI